MVRPFPAPTGHDAIAQGNALGIAQKHFQALKGRDISWASGGLRIVGMDTAPSGRGILFDISPRALPWAIALRPFGAEYGAAWELAPCDSFGLKFPVSKFTSKAEPIVKDAALKLPHFSAPTGHDAIAQGNALGIGPKAFPSPEGAGHVMGFRRDAYRGDGCRPFRAGNPFRHFSQGDALGYHIAPRWGGVWSGVLGYHIALRWGWNRDGALGYRIAPRWGENRGDVLGYRNALRWRENRGGVGASTLRRTWAEFPGSKIHTEGRFHSERRAVNRPFPAPPGHNVIAQGNALGMSFAPFPSPERA